MVRFAIALGAVLLSGAALAAPESLTKVDTDKGEILLEVQANGSALARIIKVSTICELRVSGSSKEDAQKLLKTTQNDLRSAFSKNGLSTAKLDFSAVPAMNKSEYAAAMAASVDYAADAAATAAEAAADAVAEGAAAAGAMAADAPLEPQITLTQNVGISAGSASEMQLAKAIFEEGGCNEDYRMARRPDIVLSEPDAAKAKATAEALQSAKMQAEHYAAALKMKVVRMLRVSESGAIREFLGSESEFIMREMSNDRLRGTPLSNDVPVTASIAVDFVLGPKP
jgi:hypothetical protein